MEFINNNFTNPTKTNPLMNVALTEYIDDPEREAAAPAFNKNVISNINEQTKEFVVNQFANSNSNEKKVIKDRSCKNNTYSITIIRRTHGKKF